MNTALIAGATGLVGQQLLNLLIADDQYQQIIILSRRPLSIDSEKVTVLVCDFDHLAQQLPEALGNTTVDRLFCCLGTTIKDAGSQLAFRRVDYDYCYQLASIGLAHGAKQFLLVSALGANVRSPSFYSRTKGELEQAVKKLGYPSLSIFHPSLLDGERENKRSGEERALQFMRPLQSITEKLLPAYAPIADHEVAKAMQIAAAKAWPGVEVVSSKKIRILARYS